LDWILFTAELAKKFSIADPISKITPQYHCLGVPPSINFIGINISSDNDINQLFLYLIVLGQIKEKIEKISLSPDLLIPMKLMEGGTRTPNQLLIFDYYL
jgi:hypothetical protein